MKKLESFNKTLKTIIRNSVDKCIRIFCRLKKLVVLYQNPKYQNTKNWRCCMSCAIKLPCKSGEVLSMKPIGNKFTLKKQPKKVGLETKIPSKDELLITMIKLRLELLIIDLFQLFRISQCLCIQIFYYGKIFQATCFMCQICNPY